MDQPLGVDVEEAPTRDLAALAQSLPKSSSSAGPQHKVFLEIRLISYDHILRAIWINT